jgi:phosphoglycolate phosphatase-like HAD superfamily hydrolase
MQVDNDSSDVLDFISEYSGVDRDQITKATRIVEDLGIAGDDGDDFIAAFCEQFEIEPSSFAPWMRQFGSEGGPDPISLLWALYSLLRDGCAGPRQAFAVGDLVDVLSTARRANEKRKNRSS